MSLNKPSRRGLFGLFAGLAAAPVAKKVADAMPVDPVPPPVTIIQTPPLRVMYPDIHVAGDFWDASCICYHCGDVDGGCKECT